MAIANWTCVSWVAYAPGNIAVNVTWIEREFNACQTHRSMYKPIFNRLRAIARYWSEIATFSYPLAFNAPAGGDPSEFREDLNIHKTSMNGLSCGEEIMTIRSAVLIQCLRVTDRQTDRRTDGQTDRRTDVQPISITCFSIADARKN